MGIIEFLIETEAFGVADMTSDGEDVWFFWFGQAPSRLPRKLHAAFKRLRPKLKLMLRSPCQSGWENAPHPKTEKALAEGRLGE